MPGQTHGNALKTLWTTNRTKLNLLVSCLHRRLAVNEAMYQLPNLGQQMAV